MCFEATIVTSIQLVWQQASLCHLVFYYHRPGSHGRCTVSVFQYLGVNAHVCLCCSVPVIFSDLSSKNSLLGKRSRGGLRAVCHGHVWLHDGHGDGGADRYCWSGIGGWEQNPSTFSIHPSYLSWCFQITGTKPLFHLPFCKGDDMESLLFHFLDDWLYKFSAELFFVPRVSVCVYIFGSGNVYMLYQSI